ncbi:MAG: hypothetical protein R3325_05705 [Thermoanaerobaculia bacterium]|nr:hypothetical protein [Thermoanaerobaculia bacterium]
MHRVAVASVLVLLAFAVAASPARAQTTVVEGQTEGGAFYRIEMPPTWNGKLVIWNHGFDLGPVGPVDDTGPLALVHLLEGYATAASSYRQNGWAVFDTSRDLELLVEAFESEFGVPDEVLLYGASLGGIVTAAALEQADLGNLTGALAICGAMAGSRNWDGAIDVRLLYDWVCRKVPEAALPGGGGGLPPGAAPTPALVAQAVNACTGVDLPAGERTRTQRRNLKKLLKFAKIPEQFVQIVMGYATFALADLIQDPDKLDGKQGVGNANVDYGKKRVNRQIERVETQRGAERRLTRNFTPDGDVGSAKVVSLHTDKDGLVIVENQHSYAQVVPPDKLTVAVVVEEEPTHCGFSPAEVYTGWQGLISWIGSGIQPTASDLGQVCPDIAAILGGPCRFDPSFQLKSIDRRIRPRDPS